MATEENTFLVTNISPLFSEKGEKTINECFREEMAKADKVEISVAYCGYKSLQEIDRLVKKGDIKSICLILGMYFFIGLQKKLYRWVIEIHEKWQKAGVGEIRLADFFPHHGKLYCFYKKDHLFSAIIGSPNLSFLTEKNKKKKPRQYEIAQLIHKHSWLMNYQKHIEKLRSDRFSKNMTFLESYKNVVITKKITKWGAIIWKTKITYTKNY